MPELPEVETVCRSLRPHLVGRTIARCEVLEPRLRVLVDEKRLKALAGKRIDAITRHRQIYFVSIFGRRRLGFSSRHVGQTDLRRAEHGATESTIISWSISTMAPSCAITIRAVSVCRWCRNRRALHELPQLRRLGIDPFDPALTRRIFVSLHPRDRSGAFAISCSINRSSPDSATFTPTRFLPLTGIKPTTRAHRLTRKQVQAHRRSSFPSCSATRFAGAARRFPTIAMPTTSRGEFQNHLRVYDRDGETMPGLSERRSSGSPSATAARFIVRHAKNECMVESLKTFTVVRIVLRITAVIPPCVSAS